MVKLLRIRIISKRKLYVGPNASVWETIQKLPLVEAQNALENKKFGILVGYRGLLEISVVHWAMGHHW